MKYKIVHHSDPESFGKIVEDHLKIGYKLHGNPFTSIEKSDSISLTNGDSLYNQAMIKE